MTVKFFAATGEQMSDPMETLSHAVLPLLGRLLLSVIFVTSAISKSFGWAGNVEYMTSKHLPLIPVLLFGALLIEALGSLCLIAGFAARAAATMMFLYMIPVTLLHDFMGTHFQKNLGIMGGLLMIAAFGPGRLAVSAARGWRQRKLSDVSTELAGLS
jgi:putative oxidoreductase